MARQLKGSARSRRRIPWTRMVVVGGRQRGVKNNLFTLSAAPPWNCAYSGLGEKSIWLSGMPGIFCCWCWSDKRGGCGASSVWRGKQATFTPLVYYVFLDDDWQSVALKIETGAHFTLSERNIGNLYPHNEKQGCLMTPIWRSMSYSMKIPSNPLGKAAVVILIESRTFFQRKQSFQFLSPWTHFWQIRGQTGFGMLQIKKVI